MQERKQNTKNIQLFGVEVSLEQAGLRRSRGQGEEQRQGGTGVLYISFRSSRVWSSILCVQRCSSLVHFSLSSGGKGETLQKPEVNFKGNPL